jgi:hypothetical protein
VSAICVWLTVVRITVRMKQQAMALRVQHCWLYCTPAYRTPADCLTCYHTAQALISYTAHGPLGSYSGRVNEVLVNH